MFHNEQKYSFENSVKLMSEKQRQIELLHLNFKALTFINLILVLYELKKLF